MARDVKYNFANGMYRLIEPNSPEYPNGAAWTLYNMIYERDSTEPEKMKGSTRIGGTTNFGGRVTGLFDYQEGTRLIACDAAGKINQRTAGDFAQATNGTGFDTDADTRWSGGMFHGVTTNESLLLISNGVDVPQKYTSSAGVSALGGSPPATGKYGTPFVGRWWLASGSTLYYSAADNAEDWTQAGGSIQVDRGSGDITGLTVFMNHLIVFKRDKIFHIAPTSTLESASVWQASGSIGCSSHHTIKESAGRTEGSLFFLSDNGVQGLISTNRTGDFSPANISEFIKPVVDRRSKSNQDTAWADFNEDRGEYWLQYGTSTSTPSEGVIANVVRGQGKVRWSQHNYAELTAGTAYSSSDEIIQIVGNVDGQVLQLHIGHDRDGASYVGRFQSPSYSQGAPGDMKQYRRVFCDVKTNGNYAVGVNLTLARKGWSEPGATQESVENMGVSDGWGVGLWGSAQWGGGGVAGKYVRLSRVRRGHYLRTQIDTTGIDQPFKVNGLIIEYESGSKQVTA